VAVDKPTLEIVIQRLDQLTKLQESLLSSNNSARNLETTFNSMRTLVGQIAGETVAFNKAMAGAGTSANNLLKNLGAGGVENLLALTNNKGKIAKLKGEYGKMGADLVTAIYAGMRSQSKALDLLPKIKLKDAIQEIASRNKSILADQIIAQRSRVFAATAEADAKLARGQTAGLGILEKEQAALAKLEKGLIAVNRAEEARILLLKRRGEAAAIASRQESIPVNGGKTFAQLALPGRGTTPAQGIANRLGDPNYLPQLFKIQAGLLGNYLIMSQIFSLFSFGSRFVVEFDKALQDLAAVADLTDTEMVGLKDTIIDVASTTKFTAVDISKAALILGQAGFGAEQIKKAIGPISLFATAVGTDLTTAAESASSVLNIFNLSVDDTAHVADVLVGAINKTKLTTDKLVTGLQYAGNAAAQSGATFEETVAVLGALANAGIKSGSTLGTGLRNVIIELQNPSKKLIEQLQAVGLTAHDVDINSQGLIGALQNLTKAGFGTENAFKAFEVRGAAAFLAISNNIGLASRLEKEILLTNAAAEANAKQMRSLSNVFSQFSGQLGVAIDQGFEPVKNALIVITKLSGSFIDTLRALKVVFPAFGTLLTGFGVAFAGKKIFDIAGAIGLRTLITDIPIMISGLSNVVKSIRGVEIASVAATVATTGLSSSFARVAGRGISPLSLWAVGITALIVGMQTLSRFFPTLNQQLDKANAAFNTQQSNVGAATDKINSYQEEIDRLVGRYALLSDDHNALETELLRLQIKFPELGKAIKEGAIDPVGELIEKLRELQLEASAEKYAGLQELLRISSTQQSLTLQQAAGAIKHIIPPAPTSVSILQQGMTGTTPTSSPFYPIRERVLGADTMFNFMANNRYDLLDPNKQEIYKKDIVDVRTTLTQASVDIEKIIQGIYKKTQGLAEGTEKSRIESEGRLKEGLELKSQINKALDFVRMAEAKTSQADNSYVESLKEKARLVGETVLPYKSVNDQIDRITLELESQRSELSKAEASGNLKAQESITKYIAELQNTLKKTLDDLLENDSVKMEAAFAAAAASITPDSELYELKGLIESGKVGKEGVEYLSLKLKTLLAKTGEKTSESISRVGEAAASFLELTQAVFEKVNLELQRATLPLDRKSAELNALKKENEDINSPLYGRFSDATIASFDNQLKEIDTEKLSIEIKRIRNELNLVRTGLYSPENGQVPRLSILSAAGADSDTASLSDREAFARLQAGVNAEKKKELELDKQLTDATEEYNAAIGISTQNNLELSKAIEEAVAASNKQMQKNFDLGKNINRNITESLEASRAALSTFLQDWAKGTATMGDAARALGVTIVESLIKKVADAAAANVITGGSGFLGNLFGFFLGKKEGGMMRAATGRGITTRDSVPVLAQPGEYMLRQSAVQMIGKENLDMINAYGNRKMSQSRPQAYSKPADPVFLNVYVVPPNERPSMTKHDVVAAITDDMIRGGATKKLVKSISVGAL